MPVSYTHLDVYKSQGVEFSSIYASFGSKVTILQDGDVFLPREDEEIAGAVRESLAVASLNSVPAPSFNFQ